MTLTPVRNVDRKRKKSNVLPVRPAPPFPLTQMRFLTQTHRRGACASAKVGREAAQPRAHEVSSPRASLSHHMVSLHVSLRKMIPV